jgi:hypothetical protein
MKEFLEPRFEPHMLEDHRPDGYWIEGFDIDNDGLPDLVGYGLSQESPGTRTPPGSAR